MLLRLLMASTVVASVFVSTNPAEACSPPQPGFAASVPRPGELAPANTRWFVDGYEVDPVSGFWLDFDIFLPLTVVRRHGFYEFTNEFGPYNGFSGADLTAEPGVDSLPPLMTHLEIDDTIDTTPPRLAEERTVRFEFLEDEPGLCQRGGFNVVVEFSSAVDQFGIGIYVLYEVTGAERARRGARLGHGGVSPNPIRLHAFEGQTGGRRCYVVDAIDFAGNVVHGQEPTCVDLTKDGFDAGVIDGGDVQPRPDAGPHDAQTTPNNPNSGGDLSLDRGRGCACSAQTSEVPSTESSWIFGLFAAVVLRRRVTGR